MRSRTVPFATVLILLLAGAAWWWRGRGAQHALHAADGTIATSYFGSTRGEMHLPATVHWCPVTRTGILEGISGDSGIAIVLFEADLLKSGVHPVIPAENGTGAPRPGASVAMRWYRNTPDTSIVAMRSLSGSVQLQVDGAHLSGELNARLRSVHSTDSLVLHAVFHAVPVVTTAANCT